MATDSRKSAQDRYSNNNVAHTDTWGCLFEWEEVDRNFDDSRDLPVKKFAFFNKDANSDNRAVDAKMLAAKLDRAFRQTSAATYEKGWTRAKAVDSMTKTLCDGDQLLCELAVQVDDIFKFPIES